MSAGRKRRPNARPSRPKPEQKLKPRPSQSLKHLPTPVHRPPARITRPGPPTPNIPTSFRLVKCGHPRCKLHDGPIYYPEDDRSSPYYFDGRAPPMYGNYPL